MASAFCPKCGRTNASGSAFCTYCGNPLTTSGTPPQQPPVTVPSYTTPQAPPPPSPYYGYAASYYEQNRAKEIDRTKTGLLLIVIGFLMAWIPFVGIIGGFLEFIGAILVILGRHAFGSSHARNVMWSIIIFVVGIVAVAVAAVAIVFSSIASSFPYNTTSPNFPQNFGTSFATSFAILIILGSAVFGLAEVLFTYALQNKNGRMLLWLGYVSAIVAGSVNFLLFYGNPYLSSLPSIVPAILFGYAYYLARERIVRGEIPAFPPSSQPSPGITGYTAPAP